MQLICSVSSRWPLRVVRVVCALKCSNNHLDRPHYGYFITAVKNANADRGIGLWNVAGWEDLILFFFSLKNKPSTSTVIKCSPWSWFPEGHCYVLVNSVSSSGRQTPSCLDDFPLLTNHHARGVGSFLASQFLPGRLNWCSTENYWRFPCCMQFVCCWLSCM